MKYLSKIFLLALLYTVSAEQDETSNEVEIPKIVPRIVGGKVANEGQFPHQATIARRVTLWGQYSYQQICGASIINENWLITAAHCLPSLQNAFIRRQFRVLIGSHDLNHDRKTVVGLDKVIPHPLYGSSSHSHDVGLIRTTDKMVEGEGIKFVNLPKQGQSFSGVGIATGHGKTSTHGRESDVLLHVDIEIRSDDACYQRYGSIFNSKAMVCAGGRRQRKATCMGDSGGPFVQESSDGSWTLVGLTSFGPRDCAQPFVPVVFTKVSSYINWINDTIKNYSS